MARTKFIRTQTATADQLALAVKGELYTLDADHPRFAEIVDLVQTRFDREDLDQREDTLLELIQFAAQALNTMRTLSERVSIKGETIFFDGDPIENALTEHIVKMIREGDDNFQAPVLFLQNLQDNPAKHVRKRLWEWIGTRGLTLTDEGHVIGYKGVQDTEDNRSVTYGHNTVYVDDAEHTGHIPNPVGATVTIARSAVDADRDQGCSYGLHVGTHDYASSFGSKLLTVSFNPRDVVAIPRDSGHAKIRTCRYVVLEVSEAKYSGTTYISNDAEYCGECGNPEEDCICDDEPDTDAVIVNPFAADYHDLGGNDSNF